MVKQVKKLNAYNKPLWQFILNPKRILFLIIVVIIFTAFAAINLRKNVFAATGINQTINFQGKVVNKDGTNVADGQYTFVFKLYDAASGGSNPWTETQNNVQVTAGIFRVSLGSVTPITGVDFNTDNIYLGINFNSDGEMTPRVRFASVPYAFNAQKVAGLTVSNTTGTLTIPNSKTIQFGGAFTTDTNDISFTTSGSTTLTLPATGTLATLGGVENLSNKTFTTSITVSGVGTDLTTGTNEALTITPNGTGNVLINPSAGGSAALVVDKQGLGDIFAASDSGVTKFVIKNDGNASSSAGFTIDGIGGLQSTKNQTLTLGGGSTGNLVVGRVGQVVTLPGFDCSGSGNGGKLTTTSGGVLTCSADSGGGGNSFWTLSAVNGTLNPINNTLDILVGGISTQSAVFSVLGVAAGTNPTASVSAQQGANAGKGVYIAGDGSVQSVNNNALTLGGTTTGDIYLRPVNGSGMVRIIHGVSGTGGLELGDSEADAINKTARIKSIPYSVGNLPVTMMLASNQASDNLVEIGGGSTSENAATQIYLRTAANNNTTIGTTRLFVGSNGFVGVGDSVTSPVARLDVADDATDINGEKLALRRSGAGDVGMSFQQNGVSAFGIVNRSGVGSGLAFVDNYYEGNNGTEIARFYAGSGVGIGTLGNTPSGTLDVRGVFTNSGTQPVAILTGTTSFAALAINNNGVGDLLTASSSSVTKFTIKNDGTASSSAGFTIDGIGNIQTTKNQTLTLGGGSTGNIVLGRTSQAISLPGFDCSGFGNGGKLTTTTGGVLACSADTSGGGGSSNWVLSSTNGTLSPINNTLDLLIGGIASTSAKFAFLNVAGGNPTFKVFDSSMTKSISMYHNGTNGVISVSSGSLDIGAGTGDISFDAGADNVVVNLSSTGDFLIERAGVTFGTFSHNGGLSLSGGNSGGNAELIVNQSGVSTNDIFAASASGVTKFLIKNDGTASSSAGFTVDSVGSFQSTNNQTLTLGGGSTGELVIGRTSQRVFLPGFNCSGNGNGGKLTTTSGGVLTCSDDTSGGGGGSNYWQYNTLTGIIAPGNLTVATLFGGTSTGSALLSIAGLANSGIVPVASISARTSYAGLVVDNTIGDIFTASSSGLSRFVISQNGHIGIGTSSAATSPSERLTVSGGNILQTAFGNIKRKGNFDSVGTANAVYIQGKYAYIADGSNGLQIVDIVDPSNPKPVGSVAMTSATSLTVAGRYAYVTDNTITVGLKIIDISNPLAPQVISTVSTSGNAGPGVFAVGKYVYFLDSTDGLTVVDVSDPANPVKVFMDLSVTQAPESIFISGKYAYVGDFNNSLYIFDISNPAFPVLIKNFSVSASVRGVYVSGSYAYLAENTTGLRIVNIKDPANPTTVGLYDTPGNANAVFVVGKYAYVADGTSGLQVIDITNPSVPQWAGTYDSPGIGNDISVNGKYAYIADGSSGMQIVDINGIDVPAAAIGSLTVDTLGVSDKVTIGNDLFVNGGLTLNQGGLMSNGAFSFVTASGSGNLIQGASTGKALVILNQTGSQDILTASSSGTTRFTISSAGVVTIGNSTNGLTFDPTTGPTFVGSARPTKSFTLSPEYAGAVLTASDSASIHTGSMTSDASPSANFRTFYEWSSTQAVQQNYTVAVRVTLPKDFSGWATSNAITIDFNTATTNTAQNKFDFILINPNDAKPTTPVVMRTANVSSVAKTWQTVSIAGSALTSGTATWQTAGQTAVIYLKMYASSPTYVQVGDIVFNYLSAF